MENGMSRMMIEIFAMVFNRRTLWRLGRSLYLKSRGDTVNEMRVNGESAIQQQLLKRLSHTGKGIVLFDVGANIGDWTLSILQELARTKATNSVDIYSFEPVPATFKTLESRTNGHPLARYVHLVPKALSSEDGSAEMFVVGENEGTNSLHVDAMRKEGSFLRISMTTADAYCIENNIDTVHYLKCDTEGHDMEVLLGAKRLFQENRIKAFQFEYNHRWIYSRHYLKDVFDFVRGTDYRLGKITPCGIEIYKDWHPELERFFEGNYVLLHADAADWFDTWTGTFDAYNTYSV